MTVNIFLLDILGTFFFSISGTLIARRQGGLDFYGVSVVALFTAVGGGSVRDIILDAHPLAWVSRKEYIIAIALGIVVAYMLPRNRSRRSMLLVLIEALAVAFAALAGLEKSLHMGANPFAAIFLGVVTATFGGIIRDVICNKVPQVLYTEVYASIILLGCSVKWLINYTLPGWNAVANISAYAIIIGLRVVAVRKGWSINQLTGWLKKGFRYRVGLK